MKVVVTFVVLVVFVCAVCVHSMPRIIGGSDTSTLNHLHQVQLYIAGYFCGGSIIDTNWVLTAAHCVYGHQMEDVVVVVNREGTNQIHTISNMTIHPYYIDKDETDFGAYPNDIALLKVSLPIEHAEDYKIKLPKANENFEGETCIITGWGLTDIKNDQIAKVLQETDGVILNDETCSQYGGYNHTHNICIHNPDTGSCSGDSGGPMVCHGNLLAGITSFGDTYCNTDVPGVYTKVTAFLNWIKTVSGVTPS